MYVHDGMLSLYEDSVTVTLCCDDMGILSVNLDYINLDDTNYEKDDTDTSQTFGLA